MVFFAVVVGKYREGGSFAVAVPFCRFVVAAVVAAVVVKGCLHGAGLKGCHINEYNAPTYLAL